MVSFGMNSDNILSTINKIDDSPNRYIQFPEQMVGISGWYYHNPLKKETIGVILPSKYVRLNSKSKSKVPLYYKLLHYLSELKYIGIIGKREEYKENLFIQSLMVKYKVIYLSNVEDFEKECELATLKSKKKKMIMSVKSNTYYSRIKSCLSKYNYTTYIIDNAVKSVKLIILQKDDNHYIFELDSRLFPNTEENTERLCNEDFSDISSVNNFFKPYMSKVIHRGYKLTYNPNLSIKFVSNLILLDGTEDVSNFIKYLPYKSITLPNSITELKDNTIAYCNYLEKVYVGDSLTSISSSAIIGCYRLNEVIVPNTIQKIGIYSIKSNS